MQVCLLLVGVDAHLKRGKAYEKVADQEKTDADFDRVSPCSDQTRANSKIFTSPCLSPRGSGNIQENRPMGSDIPNMI